MVAARHAAALAQGARAIAEQRPGSPGVLRRRARALEGAALQAARAGHAACVFGGSGLRSLSKPLFKLPGEWIPEWLDAGLRPNVVSVDFYEHTDVVDAVILGNKALLTR